MKPKAKGSLPAAVLPELCHSLMERAPVPEPCALAQCNPPRKACRILLGGTRYQYLNLRLKLVGSL